MLGRSQVLLRELTLLAYGFSPSIAVIPRSGASECKFSVFVSLSLEQKKTQKILPEEIDLSDVQEKSSSVCCGFHSDV